MAEPTPAGQLAHSVLPTNGRHGLPCVTLCLRCVTCESVQAGSLMVPCCWVWLWWLCGADRTEAHQLPGRALQLAVGPRNESVASGGC